MTIALVAAIYVTLLVFGEPEGGGVAVARDAGLDGPLLGARPASAQSSAAAAPAPISDSEAIEIALAAGAAPAPEQQPVAPLVVVNEPEAPVYYVTGTRVNFRAGPSTSSPVVGQFRLGDAAEILSSPDDTWIHVRAADGKEGYIFGRFLSPDAPAQG